MLTSLCKLSFISYYNNDIVDLFGNNILTPRDYVLIIVLKKERTASGKGLEAFKAHTRDKTSQQDPTF